MLPTEPKLITPEQIFHRISTSSGKDWVYFENNPVFEFQLDFNIHLKPRVHGSFDWIEILYCDGALPNGIAQGMAEMKFGEGWRHLDLYLRGPVEIRLSDIPVNDSPFVDYDDPAVLEKLGFIAPQRHTGGVPFDSIEVDPTVIEGLEFPAPIEDPFRADAPAKAELLRRLSKQRDRQKRHS